MDLTNLLEDRWIDVRRRSGSLERIRPCDLSDRHADDPFVDIIAPRPDFRSALYQFMIGLIQTTAMPTGEDAWRDGWEDPPSPEVLLEKMRPFRPAFAVSGEGPLFMQDTSIADGKSTPIASLLIDEPGSKTTRENRDFFVKRSRISGMSRLSAIHALITLQCMAPLGGAGHRTSLRGGGPLTTLLLPARVDLDTLWRRIWLNVLDEPGWSLVPGRSVGPVCDSTVFPWLGPVRTSERGATGTTPEDGHALQHYWAMPRRILLNHANAAEESCPLSEEPIETRDYRTRPWGPNYEGPWRHPLSPHYRSASGDWLPMHPQPGGFTYQLWTDWAVPPDDATPTRSCAATISNHHHNWERASIECRIWASGYDMDKWKPRCFYERVWPLFHFSDDLGVHAREIVRSLAGMASMTASALKGRVRDAWLRRASDHSDSSNNITAGVAARFYEQTELEFFAQISRLHDYCQGASASSADGARWRDVLLNSALETFDTYVPIESIANVDPARIARARSALRMSVRAKKFIAHIDDIANAMEFLSLGDAS